MPEYASVAQLAPIIEETVNSGGKARLTVSGYSMYPLLRNRIDGVLLEAVRTPKKGDIIFYRRPDGNYVLHRIIGMKDGAYVLCGDNQTEPEPGVLPEAVIAKVSAVYRNGKEIPLTRLWYRIYKALWTAPLTLRPAMASVIKAVSRIRHIATAR